MKRLLTLWLTFLAAFWLTRTAVSALLVQSVTYDFPSILQLVLVPLLQALAVAWVTRPLAGRPAPEEEDGFDPSGDPS